MRKFGSISSRIWKSKKFNNLKSDTSKLFYIYAHTCQHGNAVGCYFLPPFYAVGDLKKSEVDIISAIKECKQENLIDYDWDENIIRIKNFFTFNSIDNSKHALGAIRQGLDLPDIPLKAEILKELGSLKRINENEELIELIEMEFETMDLPYPFDTPLVPVRYTETDTDTNTETKTEINTETNTNTHTRTLAQQDGVRMENLNTDWINEFD